MNAVNANLMTDRRLSLSAAAELLGFAPKTLRNWRTRGIGPRSLRIAGKVFYRLADLDAFIASGVPRGGNV